MDGSIYTITLADGQVIRNLTLNGNNFISQTEISPEIFKENLTEVTIKGPNVDEVHHNMALIHLTEEPNGEWWFALRDLTADEIWRAKMQSNLDYLAMMTDVEI